MSTIKSKGRLTGLLFLGTFIAGATGTTLRGLSAESGTREYITNLIENAAQMKLAMGLDMISALIIVLISLYLFSLIKVHSKPLGVGYVALASINFIIIGVSNFLHYNMVSKAINSEVNETLLDLSSNFHESYYDLHFLILIIYSLNGGILYYFLMKSGYTSKWIAAWGLFASAVVVIASISNLLDIQPPFIVYAQNGIFVLTFIMYLLVAGFREPKYSS